jgi:hypothetical protein
LRRILVIATALVVLVAAASAYAAINTYSAKLGLTSKQAGTAKKPVTVGFTQDLKASGTSGNRTAVLLNIKTTIYGLKSDQKDFPTCSLSSIAAAHSDSACPKQAEFAKGYITAVLGAQTNFTSPGAACDPALDVWNGGPGKLSYFFVETPAHMCLGGALKTGAVGPYPGTVKQSGKNLVINVPIPKTVDFPVPGQVGSLETEHLVYTKMSKKVGGKTVSAFSSVGCKSGKRPFSVAYTATLPTAGPAKETDTVSGSAPC